MKYPILIFLIILSVGCNQQNVESEIKAVKKEIDVAKPSNFYKDCDDAKKSAFKDFSNEKYICTNHDFVSFVSLDSDFESFFETILYSKYSIQLRSDYFTSEKDRCYTITMDSLLYNKFENNVYAKTREYAKSIYYISELEKSKLLDLNKTYNNTLESHPKFIGNDKVISDYLTKTINNKMKYKSVLLKIDTEGVIFDATLDEGISFNKTKMIKDLNAFGKFVPGYLFGIKVNSSTWYSYY